MAGFVSLASVGIYFLIQAAKDSGDGVASLDVKTAVARSSIIVTTTRIELGDGHEAFGIRWHRGLVSLLVSIKNRTGSTVYELELLVGTGS